MAWFLDIGNVSEDMWSTSLCDYPLLNTPPQRKKKCINNIDTGINSYENVKINGMEYIF